MTSTAKGVTQERAARLAGGMFLFVNATGIFSEVFVRGSLLSGDASEVAENIINAERMYRLSIAGDLVTFAGVLVLVWALYILLRPVNRDLAMLAGLFRIVEAPVGVAATIASLTAVRLLSRAEYLDVFDEGQLYALSRVARGAFGLGQDVGFVFVGLGSTVFAYLLLRSRYVPRVLAGWGVFASLLFTVYNLAIIVLPGTTETLMYVSFAPMGVYEIGMGLWLLLRGANIRAHLVRAT